MAPAHLHLQLTCETLAPMSKLRMGPLVTDDSYAYRATNGANRRYLLITFKIKNCSTLPCCLAIYLAKAAARK